MAMIVSAGQRVEYAFLSDELKEFRDISWPKKGSQIPDVPTATFNRGNGKVSCGHLENCKSNLKDWFGGKRSVPLREEIIGLGSYVKTLTILSAEIFSDEDDEDEDLERSWTPKFK